MCVFSDQVVRLTAQIHEVVEAARRFVSSIDDVRHVGGEDEGGAVSAWSHDRQVYDNRQVCSW